MRNWLDVFEVWWYISHNAVPRSWRISPLLFHTGCHMGPSICVNVGRVSLGILSGINRKRIRVSSPSHVQQQNPNTRDILFRCLGDAVSRQQLREPWLAKHSAPASRINGRPLITALSQNATGMLIKLQPHWEKAFESHLTACQHMHGPILRLI